MINALLERIAGYNHRIAEVRARMYEEESEEDWDDRESDENYDDDSVPESLSPEQGDDVVSDGRPEEMVFDETEEIIEGHPFHTDGAVRYIVSPDNPWYLKSAWL